MKNYLLSYLKKMLRFLAQLILNKYQPQVVAITGSVGKTSTKEAIYTVLSSTYNVRTNIKNYNNEIGIPLTIIGSQSGNSSPVKWLLVFLKAISLIIFKSKKYPQILILEMGADRPGDIKYLTSFVPVKIGIVTAVGPSHLEFFENIDAIAKEKGTLIRGLTKKDFAVLNTDDDFVRAMADKTNAEVISYGFNSEAQIQASQVAVSHQLDYQDISTIQGISFKLLYKGNTVPVLLPRVIGEHLVYTALVAIAVGLIYDLNLHTIIESLKNFEPPKGRMHLIAGIKNTLIIDDTYNASPLSVDKALDQLAKLPCNGKRYAILGDMLELGRISEEAHQEIGKKIAKLGIDYLIAVGELARDYVRGAEKAGMNADHLFSFSASQEAGKFLQQRLEPGDIVLVKGSQGLRMEKVVKETMADPGQAEKLLVRQDKSWQES